MSVGTINPTRMELTKTKRQLATAERGHKLLKDKQDEMVRQFIGLINKNRALRLEIENEMANISHIFQTARLKTSYEGIMEALAVPTSKIDLSLSQRTIMNIDVPKLDYAPQEKIDLTYGFAFTPGELDQSVLRLSKLLPKLIELAETEKACDMLAVEIEKTRRRVNAIEYVMIPNMRETIHYISMKLEDNERSNIIRLMKSKDIILAKRS